MTEEQIKHMVDRFLSWKLPENFNPDGGITFKKAYNEHTTHPGKHEPSGTNLFDATQAAAMVRYMLEGSLSDEKLVSLKTYESAVRGRADFRSALIREREKVAITLSALQVAYQALMKDGDDLAPAGVMIKITDAIDNAIS